MISVELSIVDALIFNCVWILEVTLSKYDNSVSVIDAVLTPPVPSLISALFVVNDIAGSFSLICVWILEVTLSKYDDSVSVTYWWSA